MPRPPRRQIPGEIYHLTGHAVAGTRLVRRNSDRQRFLDEVAGVVRACGWTCLAATLVDNHYHLLVQISEANLSRGMQHLNGRYAAFFNRKYRRAGHLFGRRFWSGPVLTPGHLLLTIRYIARNRTAASVARDPGSDEWSSYPGVVGKAPCWPFIARDEVLALFGPPALAVELLIAFVEGGDVPGGAPPGVRPP